MSVSILLTACGMLKKPKEPVAFTAADYPYIEKFHEGIRLKQRGQISEAIKAFEYCRSVNPNDDAVHYALSELYLQSQQLSKSMESVQKAAKLDPKNQWYVQELAYMYFQSGNFTEASKHFQKLVEKEPRNIDWLFSYAESLMRSNDTQGAIKVLDKLQDQVGANPQLAIEKFRLYRQIKQDEKALNEITQALKEFPNDAQLLANLVDYYFEKKQAEKAFNYLIKLAEADPDNGNAHLALAQYYDQKGDRKESYSSLKKAFACDDIPLDQKMKILISMFDAQAKLEPEMFELVEVLEAKYPDDAKVYAIKGDFLLKNDLDKEALTAFRKALSYDDSRYAIWKQVLLMEYQEQDFEKLYVDSKKCLELFPTMIDVYLLHGVSATQTKRYQEAIDILTLGQELVIGENPMKAEFLAQKGEAYFGLQDYKAGKENYDKALKLLPNNNLTLNNYAYRLALAKTDLDKAEQMIREVLAVSPNEAHFLDTYGWVLFQKGNYAEAKEKISQAYELRKEDKLITEHMGDVSAKTGKTQEAVTFWLKAKELGSTNKNLDKKIERKEYYEPLY